MKPGARPQLIRGPMLARCGREPAWTALGLLALAWALQNCAFPAPKACALACGEAGACPDGFECQAESQACVPRGFDALCPLQATFAEQPAPPDAAGGSGAAGPAEDAGSSGGAGLSGSAGAAGENGGAAGGAGEPLPDPGELAIVDVSASSVACTGSELGLRFRASGGVAPFAFRLVRAPAGVELQADDAGGVALIGTPTEAGEVEFEVQDANGQLARYDDVVVYESPQIDTRHLPPICSGEAYRVELAAAGGERGEYVWSATPAADSFDTLGDAGFALSGATLSFAIDAAGEGAAPFRLVLGLHDSHCSASQVSLAVDVVPADSDDCPVIGVVDSNGEALPPPCLGNAYTEALSVEGGEPPYTWTELAAPPGLFFDPESATLEGVAEGDGVLAVALTDAAGRTIEKSFDVRARDKCWLAYVASEPSPSRLELVDSRLLGRQPDAARRTFPGGANADPVIDFAFSPDGRFITYRLGPAPNALRLELVRASDGQTRAVDLPGSVGAYAWSDDGSRLAVAFTSNDQTFIGGVDLTAVDRVRVAPGGRLDGVRAFAARAVPSVDSALTWYDGAHLAFLSRTTSASARRRLVRAQLEADRFSAPVTEALGDFSDAARSFAGAGGVFVSEPETGGAAFYPSRADVPVVHAVDVTVAPSGRLVGFARAGGLELFRATEPSDIGSVPALSATGCSTLLAWASARDRVACSDDRDGKNQIAVFDVSGAGTGLAQLSALLEPYVYPLGEQRGQRRLFSPSGRFLAFASADELYVARFDEQASHLSFELPAAVLGTRPGALAFAPDESWLSIGAGNAIALLDLDDPRRPPVSISQSALIDAACSERFADAADLWCGGELTTPDVAWSSGSDLVAYRSSLGSLVVSDVSGAHAGSVAEPIAPDPLCSEACRSAATARFQP